MKKIAAILSLILILSGFSSCKAVAQKNVSETSVTLQAENPTESLTISETTQTTAAPETTAETTTATVATTQKPVTTTVTTKAPPVTTKQTAPPPVTTVATTVTTPAPPPAPSVGSTSYQALNFSEQKAMWISFREYENILKGKSEAQFKASVATMYDDCKSMGINTLYVHARSHSDAYYQSDIFPWSANVTGKIDVAPQFDPFQILVDEAHKRGLSIHAWINPMRGMNDTYIKAISDKYLIKQWYNDDKKNGTYISLVNGVWYCNPAYKEVRDMITNGAKEILSKYNVDGIHIDDYFYPTTEKSFDAAAFAQSKSNNLTQWRLDTVSTMVKELYSGIKSVNPTALFGVSPQGNINNNYSTQYADVKKWCSQSGYLDYIVPQIYFGFKNKYQPYQTNMNSWCAMVTAPNVKMVVGLAPYKIGTEDSTGEWQNDANILARQVETFKNSGKYGGAAFFRYESIFKPAASVKNQVNNELAALKEKLK